MRLSISNIAWNADCDTEVYKEAADLGYTGLEIAPTRIFPDNPYGHLDEAAIWAKQLKEEYGLSISSMQSIWYGRQEKVFGSKEERRILVDYTKRAIDFAEAIDCRNLVFGCPRNRAVPQNMEENEVMDTAMGFFYELGEYAREHHTVVAIEANPPIYNTNYMNTTAEALELVKQVHSSGFLLNVDVGTMIHNEETISLLEVNISYINHVHMSEPGLKPIQERMIHNELLNCLSQNRYRGFVSIEMGIREEVQEVVQKMKYLKKLTNE